MVICISKNGIIQIIEKYDEQNVLLKNLILKAISAINNSKDIIQYFIILENIKENHKVLNNKLNQVLEENSYNNKLLNSLMSDMNRYLTLINSKNEIEDIGKEGKKVYEGLFDNNMNIVLRLDFIFILLQNNINEENLANFNKEIINSCQKYNFANECLNKYINKHLNEFNIQFIQFLYNNLLLSKDKTTIVDAFNL